MNKKFLNGRKTAEDSCEIGNHQYSEFPEMQSIRKSYQNSTITESPMPFSKISGK